MLRYSARLTMFQVAASGEDSRATQQSFESSKQNFVLDDSVEQVLTVMSSLPTARILAPHRRM